VLKFIAAFITGSSSMMAEALLSFADTLIKKAGPKVDMIFLENARESQARKIEPIP
jgi:hypothetical protein